MLAAPGYVEVNDTSLDVRLMALNCGSEKSTLRSTQEEHVHE